MSAGNEAYAGANSTQSTPWPRRLQTTVIEAFRREGFTALMAPAQAISCDVSQG
jgi:hypothetical protein